MSELANWKEEVAHRIAASAARSRGDHRDYYLHKQKADIAQRAAERAARGDEPEAKIRGIDK